MERVFEPVDPEKLIRSIDDLDCSHRISLPLLIVALYDNFFLAWRKRKHVELFRHLKLLNRCEDFESVLRAQFEGLLSSQEAKRTRYEAGDLLWKPEAVWAENRINAAWDENADAYLHLRAAIAKVKLRLFVNVTKAAQLNERLARSLVALDEIQ